MSSLGKTLRVLAVGLAAQFGVGAASAAVTAHKTVPGASVAPLPGTGLTTPEDLQAFLDGAMANALQAHNIAGATVAVVKDGQLFFAKGYGYADVEKKIPVDPEKTLFRPGSVSKLFTWTAVMQLVEQGKLDLDADVNKYITQFQIPATFKEPITLRNIMTHTTGFEDGAIGFLFVNSPDRFMPLAEALKKHMPARINPPATDMGNYTGSAYSNWATALAGLIVANVSGMSFEDYIDKNIYAPLGMTHATFREPLPASIAAHMSGGYVMKNGVFEKKGFEYIHNFAPAGSMSASATDMARFMIAHLQDGRYGDVQILKPETAQLMHTRAFAGDPHVNGIALGFYELYSNGRRTINHGGATAIFKSDLMLLPEEKVGLFISFNGPAGTLAGMQIRKAFMDRYFPAQTPDLKVAADFSKRAQDYAGTYRTNRNNFSSNEKVLASMGDATVVPLPSGRILTVGLLGGPTQWGEIAPDVFRKIDGEDVIAFKRDANGKVNAVITNFTFMSYAKIAPLASGKVHGILLGIGILLFIAALITAIATRRTERDMPRKARQARWILAATGVADITFLVLAGIALATGLDEMIFGFPPLFSVALAFPLLSIVLTLAAVVYAGIVWKERFWSLGGRIVYSLTVLFAVIFLLILNYWNLIGYNFG